MCLKSPGTDVGAAGFERCPRTFETHFIRIVKIKEISRRGRLQNSLTLGTNIIDFADIEGEGVKYVAVIYGSSLMGQNSTFFEGLWKNCCPRASKTA